MKGIVIDLKDISDSREVMESKESPKIRWFIYILLIVVVSAIVFACVFRIDEYTKVTGEVKTQETASSVLSASSCKLDKILVSEGQSVRKGDVLFVLDADYAEKQKAILKDKLDTYNFDLKNTELLKKSIEEDTNLFKSDSEDSKYYYRFEQYKNGTLLTAQEIGNTSLSDDLSKEEQENNLASAISSIAEKNTQLAEYKSLLNCIRNNMGYSGNNETVNATYNEYDTSYRKADLLCEQYWKAYCDVADRYNEQVTEDKVTPSQVENAKAESEQAYAAMNSVVSAYLSDIRSQILLIENQLISDSENEALEKALADYNALKNAIEQGSELSTDSESVKVVYEQYITQYQSLYDDYTEKSEEYSQLYNVYTAQSSKVQITEADITNAKNTYNTAIIDRDSLKNSYISQIENKVSALNEEIKSLENNKKSLEVSLKNVKDLKTYEKLSSDKLKNEAIITVNSEIDSLNDNIISLQSQMVELDETIRNSEIKASVDGTVTLINNLSTGDIVQAGTSLCSIIPVGDELKVNLYIPESEVAKIAVGQKTEYIFDAIPYNEYGKVTGEITSISADSISNESSGMKYYIAQATLSENTLTNKDGNVREIRTGMLLEAKSISGSKKIITWLLEKLNFVD